MLFSGKSLRLAGALVTGLTVLAGCYAPTPHTKTFVQEAPVSQSVVYNSSYYGATTVSGGPGTVFAPSGPVVDDFAINLLNSLQARSIREQREYCGFITITPSGGLRATPPRAGTFAGCEMPLPRAGQGVIASFHTHGSYAHNYDNEVPSTNDLMADFSVGIDGYVSTPGGRVWLVDYASRTTQQLCGLGCVISDPHFRPSHEAGIYAGFTLPQLRQRTGRY